LIILPALVQPIYILKVKLWSIPNLTFTYTAQVIGLARDSQLLPSDDYLFYNPDYPADGEVVPLLVRSSYTTYADPILFDTQAQIPYTFSSKKQCVITCSGWLVLFQVLSNS